ncbi:transmembrane protease serine 4-like [Nasonia vitripennis]|uniref:Peptidase S1 domain-containing protein n=1 Tax=Nasonia vitripennis TaxID=7425 RepID=A0A7M7HAY2_NASVI|nr:transmembrane protease serine 4-like [Nasonia vitripennis]
MSRDYIILPIFFLSSSLWAGNVSALKAEAIIGAEAANEGQFKYQVSIQVHKRHICGGGIIADKFVLTAAHCFINDLRRYVDLPYKVVAGTSDLSANSSVEVNGDMVYTLARFAPPPYDNDIAVLKLSQSLGLDSNPKLSKLDLPKPGNYYVGEQAVLVGYGYSEIRPRFDLYTQEIFGYTKTNHLLRRTQVRILDKDVCNAEPAKYKLNAHKQLCGRVIRDGSQVRGTCRGDSGSPLVINNTIIGVLSTGSTTCDDSDEATWYSRVSQFLRFIGNAVKDANRRSIRFDEIRQS